MNYKRHTYKYLLLLPLALLFSCSQEELPAVAGAGDEAGIIFRAPLPSVSSRVASTEEGSLLRDGFHVSAINPLADVSDMHFEDILVTQTAAGTFASDACKWPATRDGSEGRLRFFAYYPSCDVMRGSAGVGSDHFILKNHTQKSGGGISYDYRIEKFKVPRDIACHVDFVTATAEGTKAADLFSGVKLDFEHQLSRVTLQAWGNSDSYNVEIAGVRIGCAAVEGDFNFAGVPASLSEADRTRSGSWLNPVKGNVDYIFRTGDKVISVAGGSHDSADRSASIMGSADRAMAIPAEYTGWDYRNDAPDAAQGLYFSVLLRVDDKAGMQLYPYTGGAVMEVVSLSVNNETGEVMARLYKGDSGYFSDPRLTEPYMLPATEEARDYAWAAVPVSATWKPGYEYTYTLDFSNGIGLHEPDTPAPGSPIIYPVLVGVTEAVSITNWDETNAGNVDMN